MAKSGSSAKSANASNPGDLKLWGQVNSADLRRQNEVEIDCAALLDGFLRIAQNIRLRFNDWLSRFELNDGRYAVLTVLNSAGESGSSQAALAEKLGQSESNVSTLIERMQRDGLVNRVRSSTDRRKRVLSITAKGNATLNAVDAQRSQWACRQLRGVPLGEREKLLSLLSTLGAAFDRNGASPSPKLTIFWDVNGGDAKVAVVDPPADPSEDPQTPQFALRQMLLALSASAGGSASDKEAA